MTTELKAVLGRAGTGKAVPLDTPIFTPEGFKEIGKININDYIIGDDGLPTQVLDIIEHESVKMYELTFTDNTKAIACEDHNWRVQTSKLKTLNKWRVLTTKELIYNTEKIRPGRQGYYYNIPIVSPIKFPEKEFILDPYLLGVFLGNGCFEKSGTIDLSLGFDQENEWENLLPEYTKQNIYSASTCFHYKFKQFKKEIKLLKLIGKVGNDKFIPNEYLYGSINQRLELLQGLMDTDGSIFKKESNSVRVSFSNCNLNIIKGVQFLVYSLGGLNTLHYDYRNKYTNGVCYELNIQLPNFNPFKLPRKKVLYENYKRRNFNRKIKSIKYIGLQAGRCITVNNKNNCYIINDFIVTHNSFYINSLLKQDRTFGLRTASTGIAALNMESIYNVDEPTTINSALRFFNTEDLLRSYHLGKTSFALKPIANKYKNIILDEVGMINAGTLDLIVLALDKFNAASPKKLGLLICGDVGQLEPVEGSPCFMANCWPRFNIEYLTEVKRQDNYEFVEALSLVREGNIKEALPWFKDNINFIDQPNYSFRGTTFFALNDEVNYFNKICLDKLQGKSKTYKAELKGVAHPTWSSIPQTLTLKPGSIIQILYNNLDYGFANGDSAIVQDLWEKSIYISLLRKNKDFFLKPRELLHYTFNNKGYTEKKPIGKLTVLHCKLMYAASAHKGQGLSLDNVQINLKGRGQSFFGRQSGMLYTALSRVRTPEGLTLIGTPEDLIKCCYVNPLYKPWIK